MPQKSLANLNDTIQIDLSKMRNGAVALQTGAGAHAAANFVLELSVAGSAAGLEWITPISMTDPTTGVAVTSLTGPSKSGWAECPGYDQVRVRRTEANGGDGTVAIEFREG